MVQFQFSCKDTEYILHDVINVLIFILKLAFILAIFIKWFFFITKYLLIFLKIWNFPICYILMNFLNRSGPLDLFKYASKYVLPESLRVKLEQIFMFLQKITKFRNIFASLFISKLNLNMNQSQVLEYLWLLYSEIVIFCLYWVFLVKSWYMIIYCY